MAARNLVVLFLLASAAMCGDAQPSYKGLIQLPVSLYLRDGSQLPNGPYDIEVKPQGELIFSQEAHVKASVKGVVLGGDADDPPVDTPLMGTQYLRSTADPVGTEAERHFSKTGRTQYEEENREWKGALRVFRSPDQKEAILLFDEKLPRGRLRRSVFRLSLNGAQATQGRAAGPRGLN